MKKIYLAIIILLIPLIIYSQEKGKEAPAFSGKTADGETVSLSDYKGKVLVVDFWASWCRPCKEGYPFLLELFDQYSDKDFSVLGINLDEEVSNMTNFLKKLGKEVKFKNISDSESKIGNIYKVEAIPTTLIIDKKGKVRYSTLGYNPDEKSKFKSEIEALLNE